VKEDFFRTISSLPMRSKTGDGSNGNYHDTMQDDPFMFLEIKAVQIRKMQMGSLLLRTHSWNGAL
jgi:hypothetical protein